MKKGIKKKDHEKLSDSNISHVISLLRATPPITKKEACAILNISYNTIRLAKIIEEYEERKTYEANRREKNRGKPAQPHEIQSTVELYLAGDNVTDIAKRLYRSSSFINAIIERIGVPVRPVGDDRYKKAALPDACIATNFSEREIVWSAKYHRPSQVIAEINIDYALDKPGLELIDYEARGSSKMYRIYVMEPVENVPDKFANVSKGGFYAYSYAYDLGKLEHLKEFGIDITKL